MSRAQSSRPIDPLSPPHSSQVLNAASSPGLPRQRVNIAFFDGPQDGEGESNTYGPLHSQEEQPVHHIGPKVPEQSASPERRVDAVLTSSTPRARASGSVRSRRHIVLPLDEKIRLATIAWEHRVAYLNSPIPGRFPDVLAWELIMNAFHEQVRPDVFTSPIEAKTTLTNICRTRREKSDGPEPPARSGYSDDLQGAVDLWNTVWKLRNLRLDFFKFYGSLADMIARPHLQRLCGVDPSIDILDAESMAPFLLCKPVCEELQRRDMKLRKNRRRTRGMSLYPFDSSSESDRADSSDDDAIKPDDPNPMPTIEEEHATDVESLPSSKISRQIQDRLVQLEKLFMEQCNPVDKNDHDITSARESVTVDPLSRDTPLALDHRSKFRSPLDLEVISPEDESNELVRQLRLTQGRPHKSPYAEEELCTKNPARGKNLAQTESPSSPVSPPRLLSDIMGPVVGRGATTFSQNRSSLGATEDILRMKNDSNILASLSSRLINATPPRSSLNPGSSAEKDGITASGLDNNTNGRHITPNITISDSLLRIREEHRDCSDSQGMTQLTSSSALGSQTVGHARALLFDREKKPVTKSKKKAGKRGVREGTAPELRRENEEHARRREQRRVAPLFPAIKPRVLKTIPQSTSCLFENQKQSRMLSSLSADLASPEPPRFKMPSPLPAWVKMNDSTIDPAIPDQSQGVNRDSLEGDDDDDHSNSTPKKRKYSGSSGNENSPTDNLHSTKSVAASTTSGGKTQPPTYAGRVADQNPWSPSRKRKQRNVSERPKTKRHRDRAASDTVRRHVGDDIVSLDVKGKAESVQRRSTPLAGKRERSKKKKHRQRLEKPSDAENGNSDAERVHDLTQSGINKKTCKRKRAEPGTTHNVNSQEPPHESAAQAVDLPLRAEKREEQARKRRKTTLAPRSQKVGPSEAKNSGAVRGSNKKSRRHRHRDWEETPRRHEREMTTESQAALLCKTPRAQISMLSNKYKEVRTDIGKQNEEMVRLRQELEELHRLLRARDR